MLWLIVECLKWCVRNVKYLVEMGNKNSYLSEISDDSSGTEFDYSLEPRTEIVSADHAILGSDVDNKNVALSAHSGFLDSVKPVTQRYLTTDAAMRVNYFPKPETVLSLDMVLGIEKDLELYEMVSLVYLLYDEAYCALQELILLLKGANKTPLYSWANLQDYQSWQKKLIEALCVIKNYQILKKLGYQKADLILHYLPHRINAVTCLNKVRKGIYLVCEKLDEVRTAAFLANVKRQFGKNHMLFEEFAPEFLELYFLKWETMAFISPTDLSNVKSALKIMNEEQLCDILIDCVPKKDSSVKEATSNLLEARAPGLDKVAKSPKVRKPSTSKDSHQYEQYTPASCSYGADNISKNSPMDDESHRYQIDPENPGIILIINQEDFYTEFRKEFKHLLPDNIDKNKLENRKGTEKDRDDLVDIFQRFGFKVIVKDNLLHDDMMEEIKEVVRGVRNESSLFVCIMSHGDRGVVYGVNSCKVKVSKIQEMLCRYNKENLMDKPKVLILQSCQGRQCQKIDERSEEEDDESYSISTDGPGSDKQVGPRTADMLTFWATVPGYAAIRNKRTGSWFIQALCKKMAELGNKHHFADICTRIVDDVASRRWIVEEYGENAMTPMSISTLRRDFYLPPMRDA